MFTMGARKISLSFSPLATVFSKSCRHYTESSTTCRAIGTLSTLPYKPLQDVHKEFLELVGDYGEGRILLDMNKYEGIAELVIDQPARRNAISGTMMKQLALTIDQLVPTSSNSSTSNSQSSIGDRYISSKGDSNISSGDSYGEENALPVALIVRGTGGEAFCAGADLGLVNQIVNTPERGALMSAFMTDALNRLRQSALISVACLNGVALGGGAEFATATDFRIMPSAIAAQLEHQAAAKINAQLKKVPNFSVQFVHAKIGASPGWGGARRLVNIIGRRNALRVCATAMPVNASEGVRIGLIDLLIEPPPQQLQQLHQQFQQQQQQLSEQQQELSVAEVEDACSTYYSEAGRLFLQPYVSSMVFAGSVRAIKTAVAAVEDESAAASKDIEQAMFRSRWFGRDNVEGLHSSPLSFFKHN